MDWRRRALTPGMDAGTKHAGPPAAALRSAVASSRSMHGRRRCTNGRHPYCPALSPFPRLGSAWCVLARWFRPICTRSPKPAAVGMSLQWWQVIRMSISLAFSLSRNMPMPALTQVSADTEAIDLMALLVETQYGLFVDIVRCDNCDGLEPWNIEAGRHQIEYVACEATQVGQIPWIDANANSPIALIIKGHCYGTEVQYARSKEKDNVDEAQLDGCNLAIFPKFYMYLSTNETWVEVSFSLSEL